MESSGASIGMPGVNYIGAPAYIIVAVQPGLPPFLEGDRVDAQLF
jgi:hypothetical protein